MNQNPSIEEVMQRIRARVKERTANSAATTGVVQSTPRGASENASPSRGTSSRLEIRINDLTQLRGEIDTALEGTRRVGQINPRNPGLHNDAIQLAKKVMRRSLTWYTRPLHYFQGGVIRALQRIEGILQSHEQSLQRISGELGRQAEVVEQNAAAISRHAVSLEAVAALSERTAAIDLNVASHAQQLQVLEEKVSSLRTSVLALTERLSQTDVVGAVVADDLVKVRLAHAQMSENLRQLQLQSRNRDRDIRRFFHDVRSGTVSSSGTNHPPPVSPMFPAGIKWETDFDYFAFEDLYRGGEEDIRLRQTEYLEYFRGRENVLDVGCGRGEFLELLREHNISAKGVELGTDQYLLCKEKGLDVIQKDLFSYLEALPDESLGGLFSAQVIEHLTASDQLRYVALAHQKTKHGSPVIFETINAQCVWAVMRNFFLDPTHVRPIHPETLKFAMESANFKNVELHFSRPMSDRFIPSLELDGDVRNLAAFNQRIQDLNELLYGNQDYAAIGWR